MSSSDRPGENPAPPAAKFDQYAQDYAALHAKNIAVTGEQPEYFARHKLGCLQRLLGSAAAQMRVLDYGCGVGALTRFLVGTFQEVHGFDPSPESLDKARADVQGATFHSDVADPPEGQFDIAILAGVLHHVPPAERAAVMARVRSKLKPNTGRVVVFEHNPWNPLTRRAVAMCPFDDDAILLKPGEAARLLRDTGFASVRRDFVVFFPKPLAFLRGLEPHLRLVPFGAQMMLVGQHGG